MRVLKVLSCKVCGEETVHCETAEGRIRCEICGKDDVYFLTRSGEVLRANER